MMKFLIKFFFIGAVLLVSEAEAHWDQRAYEYRQDKEYNLGRYAMWIGRNDSVYMAYDEMVVYIMVNSEDILSKGDQMKLIVDEEIIVSSTVFHRKGHFVFLFYLYKFEKLIGEGKIQIIDKEQHVIIEDTVDFDQVQTGLVMPFKEFLGGSWWGHQKAD